MSEEWRPVLNYEGLYEVSNLARVRSLAHIRNVYRVVNGKPQIFQSKRKESILKQSDNNSDKYWRVSLTDREGKRVTLSVHRLVAQAFIPNPDNLPQVNHIDTNKKNNSIENLEWCTNQYNKWHFFNVADGKYKYTEEGRKTMVESQTGVKCVNWKGYYFINGTRYTTMPEVAKGEGVAIKTVQRRLKSSKFPNWFREDVIQTA